MTTYTEDEARQKWCPFAITFGRFQHHRDSEPIGSSYGPQNRGYQMGSALENCRCIASGCMAWRWAKMDASDPRFIKAMRKAMDNDIPHSKAGAEVLANPEKYGLPTKPDRGYCGLAGQP